MILEDLDTRGLLRRTDAGHVLGPTDHRPDAGACRGGRPAARRMTSAIVLAGGASSRFGSDKLLADLDGRPVLHHAIEAVATLANPIIVVIGPDAPPPSMPAGLEHQITLMRDGVAFGGPLVGLAAGLVALADIDRGFDAAALVVAGDMPYLQPPVLALLAATVDGDATAGAATLETDPPCVLPFAIRPSVAAPVVDALLREDRRALRALLDRLPVALVAAAAWRALDPDGRTLVDIDTVADLDRRTRSAGRRQDARPWEVGGRPGVEGAPGPEERPGGCEPAGREASRP